MPNDEKQIVAKENYQTKLMSKQSKRELSRPNSVLVRVIEVESSSTEPFFASVVLSPAPPDKPLFATIVVSEPPAQKSMMVTVVTHPLPPRKPSATALVEGEREAAIKKVAKKHST